MIKEHNADVRLDIVAAGKELLQKGLVAGTWGNISARIPGEEGRIAITPSGQDYRTLAKTEITIIGINGDIFEGGQPSSEMPMHLAIYAGRSDIRAIVHTHSIFASACAVARRPIPPVIEDLVQLVGGQVEVAEYALPGTPELAKSATLALGDKQAVLLANHGLVGCGLTLGEAMLACELVEKAAQIYLYANQLGGAYALDEADVAVMRRFYLEKYRQRQRGEA